MALQERLLDDMKTSMKAGDTVRTGVLRLLRGSIKNEEIKIGHALDEAEVLKVLAREAKQRKDSIDAYREAGRHDLVSVEEHEATIIREYLPEAMTEAELREVVRAAAERLNAHDPKQMGAVIGAVMQEVGARADGGAVSKLVREFLAGGVQ